MNVLVSVTYDLINNPIIKNFNIVLETFKKLIESGKSVKQKVETQGIITILQIIS